MEEEKYFTVKEIADRYRVSKMAVTQWIAQGRLKAVRLGRVLRISQSSLEEFIRDSGRKQDTPTASVGEEK